MKKILFLIPIFAIIPLIFLLSFESEVETEPIKIAINVWPGYAHAFVAEHKGFFEQNNVNVELILTETYSEAQELYVSGKTDGIFEVYPDTIFHNSEGIKTKVVYIADHSNSADVIIGNSDSVIDLKGKRVGIEGLNSFSHIFVLTAIEKSGLTENDVSFVDIPAMQVYDSLKDGVIDAGHTWDPVKTMALNDGYSVLCESGDVPGIITDVLGFRESIVEERPEDIQNIVKSLFQARDFVYSERSEALKIMAEAEGTDETSMNEGIEGLIHPDIVQNFAELSDPENENSLYFSGQTILDFYLDRGQINHLVDFEDILEPRFVKELM